MTLLLVQAWFAGLSVAFGVVLVFSVTNDVFDGRRPTPAEVVALVMLWPITAVVMTTLGVIRLAKRWLRKRPLPVARVVKRLEIQ